MRSEFEAEEQRLLLESSEMDLRGKQVTSIAKRWGGPAKPTSWHTVTGIMHDKDDQNNSQASSEEAVRPPA